jgi:hypothetical protein
MGTGRRLLALGLGFALMLLFAQAPSGAEQGDPVVLAAGDIADCNSTGDSATAAVLDAHPDGTVLTLGDNAYESGTAQEFSDCYEPTWGRHKARTRPAPGNHEYQTPDAAGYFGYFGAAAGPGNRGYYSFDLGDWHLVSLNSERDTGLTGSQIAWLRADLAATTADCVLAYWHKARWTKGKYSDVTDAQHLWDVLYDAGADVVLAGHDHDYQRYPPFDKSGARDPERGMRSFVVGTGGRGLYQLVDDPRREAGDDDTWGVLELTLHPKSYSWRFLGVAGSTFTDSGTAECSPENRPPPRFVADFDGDGKDEIAVWRPSNGVWYVQGGAHTQWGGLGDVPVPGNYDADPADEIAVWRPVGGIWYFHGAGQTQWGGPGDVPVPADYDGDGIEEIAVWRPANGVWYVRGGAHTQWGGPGDVPVPGNYDADPADEIAVFRPSSGLWYFHGAGQTQWGGAGDVPLAGDFDADPALDLTVWRPAGGTWYFHGSGQTQWGGPGDVP